MPWFPRHRNSWQKGLLWLPPGTNAAFPALVLVLAGLVAFAGSQPAIAADKRVVIKMPPEMRNEFLEHMSHHIAGSINVIAAVATGDFKHAAQTARDKLEVGAGKGFGRYLPIEFRELGLAMHRAANEFSTAAEAASVPPGPKPGRPS